MYRILAFLTKRDDMSMSSFKEYYENHHVPLILSLAPSPLIYKRRYLNRDEKFTETGASVDFDVMTELVFPDQEAFHSWMTKLGAAENDGKVAIDEARFLDRARTRAYVIDEHVTAG